jgi:hypothetical protein
MDYQRIILSGPVIDGAPGLPAALLGLTDASLADLSAVLDPCPAEYAGIGYWPIQPAEPVPLYKVAVSRTVEMMAGQPTWVEDLADAPFRTLTRKELRYGLLSIDLTSQSIIAVISAIPDAAIRDAALIDWEDTKDYERHHPLVDTLASTLGLPSEQVDALWRWAAGR